MTDIIIGTGGDYSGVNALHNLSSDFTSMAGQGIVNVKMKAESYVYNGGVMLQQTDCDASNHFVFMAYEGQEHKGNFGAICPRVRYFSDEILLATPLNWGGNLAKLWGFFLGSGFHKFRDFIFCADGLTKPAFGSTAFRAHTTSDILMQNILVDRRGDTIYATDELIKTAYDMQFGRPMKRIIVRNCIVANPPGSVSRVMNLQPAGIFDYTEVGLGADEIEFYNCLFYNSNIDFFNQPVKCYNTGSISSTDTEYMVQSDANVIGSGNYHNGLSVPSGSTYNNIDVDDIQFSDRVNFNFNLKISSSLIGSGFDISSQNPTDIRGVIWQGSHKSPFNNIIITNSYMQPPEDTEYIRGNWMNGMIYNCMQPGGKILVGRLVNSNAYREHILGYSLAGFVTECAFNLSQNNTVRSLNGKYLTTCHIHKRNSTSGLNSVIFGNLSSHLVVDTSGSNTIRFTINTTYYGENTSLSNFVNVNDYFTVLSKVNLGASTDSERIKIYLYQKGFLHSLPLTFSGTAPSTFNEVNGQWYVGFHTDIQGITSVWDRLLSFEELFTIAYDPYVIYRSDKKLFRLTNVISEALGNGLWFLRKFIMEKARICY